MQNQLKFTIQRDHFTQDTHQGIGQLSVDHIHLLSSISPSNDIAVVTYVGSPLLSIYDARGQLVDVDHYLPDGYHSYDSQSGASVLDSIQNYDREEARDRTVYKNIVQRMLKVGDGDLIKGIELEYEMSIDGSMLKRVLVAEGKISNGKSLVEDILSNYHSFDEFMTSVVNHLKQSGGGYTHITDQGNIIITTLNKRSGVAVIIETQNGDGDLLPPARWNIVRTNSRVQLDQTLVFRTEDVKKFFSSVNYESIFDTDRYRMYKSESQIKVDSFLDNTDNLLSVPMVNNCYQILASDRNIIMILSGDQEMTLLNTHTSVVPQKWPRKIKLPYQVIWARVDENMCCAFIQDTTGRVEAIDISDPTLPSLGYLGVVGPRYVVDQNGDIIATSKDDQSLIKIVTNLSDLALTSDISNLSSIISDIAYLFKGDALFQKAQYARPIQEEQTDERTDVVPSAIEAARYDFETTIEHRILEYGDSYLALLETKNLIAIARQNIAEEITARSEKLGHIIVGQRLVRSITSIVGPMQHRVSRMTDRARASNILELVRSYKVDVISHNNTDEYREMLNNLRAFNEELTGMSLNIEDAVLVEFADIQVELNALFASQITGDQNELNRFIAGEIDVIEKAITASFEPRKLEILLSTHPAAIELMSLLKQPFVLQSVASGKRYSPAMIQTRLHDKVDKRRNELQELAIKNDRQINAGKLQLSDMITSKILFFVKNHSAGFSDQELSSNAAHQEIVADINKLQRDYSDVRLAQQLRRELRRRILDRNRQDLEKIIAVEGKYAFIHNDADLYVDLEHSQAETPKWTIQLTEKRGSDGTYSISYVRNTDLDVHKISTDENLKSGRAFEISELEYVIFIEHYERYINEEYPYALLTALWDVTIKKSEPREYPQFTEEEINSVLPQSEPARKALRCALEKKKKEHEERYRERSVPDIDPNFIDETPYFRSKLQEFALKAKLQKVSGSGIILLSGPPSTGKSAFLKFAASLMNREYFEHASDKWQTKNSLVTAIKFGEYGPYSIPAGFTRAITTSHSLINIEEIKEWPEALRKSLNPFFAGSKVFTAPDGTRYDIGDDIILCAAANLGSMYRQEDEPFTADFWSRIEVVEYDYAPERVSNDYWESLLSHESEEFLTMQDLARSYFKFDDAPTEAHARAIYFSRQLLEFILLPKADEKVKRDNLATYIYDYFADEAPLLSKRQSSHDLFNPEEATKVAFKRLRDFRDFDVREFYELYHHFCNGINLKSARLKKMQTTDVSKYKQIKVLILMIRNTEGCLRKLRTLFYESVGKTEIEGTNREFIKCVLLMQLLGEM